MEYETEKSSQETVVGELNLQIRETGKDEGDVLFKIGKKTVGIGSMVSGVGLIYDATKQQDPTRAVLEGLFGIACEVIGLYLVLS